MAPFSLEFEPRFAAVAVAASQGGVQALVALLRALPPQFPAPILVAQHIGAYSALVPILARSTRLLVQWAEDGARLRPETAFVGPPAHHVAVRRGGTLEVRRARPADPCVRPSADVLFTSMARAFGSKAVAVVLTGNGCDGTEGAGRVAAAGGVVIAQQPRTCVAPRMPSSVVASGTARFVLPLEGIASALVSLVAVPGGAALFGITPAA